MVPAQVACSLEKGSPSNARAYSRDKTSVFPRSANPEVRVRAITSDADWSAAFEGQMDAYDAPNDDDFSFQTRLMGRYRAMSAAGSGRWYGAFLADKLLASCGAFGTDGGPARFQSVVTRRTCRRRGVATTLVAEAGAQLLANGAPGVVITAAAESSAERIYRSLGLPLVDETATLLSYCPAV